MKHKTKLKLFPNRLFGRIQSKLILILCMLLIPTLFTQVYVYQKRFENRRILELESNLEVARAVAKSFDTYIMEIIHSELIIGLAITSHGLALQEHYQILDEFESDNMAVIATFWINPDGVVLDSSFKDYVGLDLSEASFLEEIVNGKKWVVSELILRGTTAKPGFTIARGIRNEKGQLLGIVGASIEPDLLDGVLGIERGKGAAINILDSKGMLVFRYPRFYPSWEERNWFKRLPQLQITMNGVEYAGNALFEGKTRIMANVPIRSIGWLAGADRGLDDTFSTIRAALLPQTIMFLLITLFAFGTAVLFSRRISGAIGKLRNHALALGRGDTQGPVEVSGAAELDDLARAFNQMTEEIESRERDRQRAEDELRESKKRFQAFMNNSPASAWIKDEDGHYIYLSEPCEASFGTKPEDCLGKTDAELFPPERAQRFRNDDLAVLQNDQFLEVVDEHINSRGIPRVYWKLKFPLKGDNGKRYVGGIGLDVTERKQMEEELNKSRDELELRVQDRTAALERANEELRQVPSRLIAALEEERKRLASELHDSIGQTLAAIKFWVEMALKLKDEGDGTAALNHLERFIPTLQHSIEETRGIYMGLRPSMLDSVGLLATLTWLRGECMKLYPDRHVELKTEVAEEEIPENLKVNIFRIAQEALNNIAKHSRAEWVDISISKNDHGIELVISDDGVGMNLDLTLQTSTAGALGLTSMRERTELTGGRFAIESTLGEGTTIRAFWAIGVEG